MTDDIERARSALFSLDAARPHGEWVELAMAAKEAGLSLGEFIEWSRTGSNFGSSRECNTVWNSCKPGGGIGAGTLFKRAREEAGWRDPREANGHGRAVNEANGGAVPTRVNGAASVPPHVANAQAESALHPSDKPPPMDPQAIWSRCPDASAAHPYIVRKRGAAPGLRVVPADDALGIAGQRMAGWLVVPLCGVADDVLKSLQFIPPGPGRKLNLPGAALADGAFLVGEITAGGLVYVCEGVGQAWACLRADNRAAASVVTAGAGRIAAIAKALRKRYADVQLVLVADRGKEADAQKLAHEVRGAWVEMPADKPANYDANDLEAEHDTDALAELLAKPRRPEMRFRVVSARELLNAPPLDWLVQGVLPAQALIVMFGQPGCGKSFVALDLACALAEGREWFGRPVARVPVVYCALEGTAGLRQRLLAWQAHHGRELPDALRFVAQPLDLRSSEDTADLRDAIMAAGGAGLVVVDTLARALPGADENSAGEVGEALAACDDLQHTLGAGVLLVHHAGKDAGRAERGSSALRAAVDASLEVLHEGGAHHWAVRKSKDGETGADGWFELHPVDIDDTGNETGSCVVRPVNPSGAAIQAPPHPTGAVQKLVYAEVGALLKASRDFGRSGAPPTRPCIKLADAITAIAPKLTSAPPNKRVWSAKRAITTMQDRFYDTDGEWLWHR